MRRKSASRRQRQQKSRGSANRRQRETLRQQLLGEAPAACPERDANRRLPACWRAANQLDGGSRNISHRQSAALIQRRQEAFRVALEQSPWPAPAATPPRCSYRGCRRSSRPRHVRRDDIEFRLGLRQCHLRREPREHSQRNTSPRHWDATPAHPNVGLGCAPGNLPPCSRTESPAAAHPPPCSSRRSAR